MNKSLTLADFFTLLLLIVFIQPAFSQKSHGGQPLSFKLDIANNLNAKAFQVTPIDLTKVLKEDEKSNGSRFAAPAKVDLDLDNAGAWTTLDNGDRVWQLKIQSKGALGLVILYDDFWLPKGARFYSYSEDRSQVLGAYTAENNPKTGRFLTGLIKGESSILEYYEPASVRGKGRISIFRVDRAYHRERLDNDYEFRLHSAPMMRGFGTALDCHINVNCETGNNWQDEKKGITRIMLVVEEGTGWCSGSLINNTRNDATPYVLSAFHCDDGYTPLYDLWRFDFHYESNNCSDPSAEPAFQSVLGCTFRAGRRESDFQLLETNGLPAGLNTFFNGWNRSNSFIPSRGTMIHHPSGDIKKISQENNPLTIFPGPINWLETGVMTPANHHFKAILDEGTFEVGSSGSPLFDQNSRIVGQLNGGNASCSEFLAYYGRFSVSWDAGSSAASRLKDWLDPDNLGIETLDGIDKSVNPSEFFTFSGSVKTPEGKGIPGVTLELTGAASIVTDNNGAFSIQLPRASFSVSLSKDNLPGAGVSVSDAVMIQQFALGKSDFDSPFQYLAADVNRSSGITVSDLVLVTQLVLGKIESFPNVNSWLFLESGQNFSPAINALTASLPQSFMIPYPVNAPDGLVMDFVGVKLADVNGSVSPSLQTGELERN